MSFETLPLWANVALFTAAGVVVWIAGSRLAVYADVIGVRTHLSHALLGLILLGVATSLPEIATTTTAARLGNAALLTGNLFGGVALQIAVLAIVDLVAVRGALTYFTPQPVLLLQGVMLLLLLATAIGGALAGEPLAFAGLGLTTVLLAAGYCVTVWMSQPDKYVPRWQATHKPSENVPAAADESDVQEQTSALRLYTLTAVSAAFILVAGWTLARTGDALAAQTHLGSSFVGVALVAASTSLPELSTTLGAVRRGRYEMAVSNILGTNCLEVALFFVADAVYRGGPVLAAAGDTALFAGAAGMVMTCLLLLGLLERRNRTILRMGVDSIAVLFVYVTTLATMYWLG